MTKNQKKPATAGFSSGGQTQTKSNALARRAQPKQSTIPQRECAVLRSKRHGQPQKSPP